MVCAAFPPRRMPARCRDVAGDPSDVLKFGIGRYRVEGHVRSPLLLLMLRYARRDVMRCDASSSHSSAPVTRVATPRRTQRCHCWPPQVIGDDMDWHPGVVTYSKRSLRGERGSRHAHHAHGDAQWEYASKLNLLRPDGARARERSARLRARTRVRTRASARVSRRAARATVSSPPRRCSRRIFSSPAVVAPPSLLPLLLGGARAAVSPSSPPRRWSRLPPRPLPRRPCRRREGSSAKTVGLRAPPSRRR